MKVFVISFFYIALSLSANSQSLDEFFKKSDYFFIRYAKNGSINYEAIKAKWEQMDELYRMLAKVKLSRTDAKTRKAFYINAYNIIVIYQLSKSYVPGNNFAVDQSGILGTIKHKVAGENLTLNMLETKKLLQPYTDPRIYFVLFNGARGSMQLADFAYSPQHVDNQLEVRTRMAVNNEIWLKLESTSNKVLLSEIFRWHNQEFTAKGQTLLQFINDFRDTEIPETFEVDFYAYDWNFNEGS